MSEVFKIEMSQQVTIRRVIELKKSEFKDIKEAEKLVAAGINNLGFDNVGEWESETIEQLVNDNDADGIY